jgi:hypothetical protein
MDTSNMKLGVDRSRSGCCPIDCSLFVMYTHLLNIRIEQKNPACLRSIMKSRYFMISTALPFEFQHTWLHLLLEMVRAAKDSCVM